jgi:hypothetical protein
MMAIKAVIRAAGLFFFQCVSLTTAALLAIDQQTDS